jgi:hypothetical protein
MPDFATRWWGQQYEVIRRGPGGDTRHKAWALDVTDAGGRFDPRPTSGPATSSRSGTAAGTLRSA